MMDIVDKLRCEGVQNLEFWHRVGREAADEIERLQKERDALGEEIVQLRYELDDALFKIDLLGEQ
jgi:hypothetical protein